MLEAMRRHARSWAIKAILYTLIAIFVVWGVSYSYFTRVKAVAVVNGSQILSVDIDEQAREIQQRIQNQYGPDAAEMLTHFNVRQQAVDALIDQRLIVDEAKRLGIQISDAALQDAIAHQSAFQVNGEFNFAAYRQVLRDNGFTPPQFENRTRTEMIMQTLQRMVAESVQVSDAGPRDVFDRHNAHLSLAWAEGPYSAFLAGVKPTDKQIAAFYADNRESFREPERIVADFIRYDPDSLAASVQPSDKEINDYYERNRDTVFTHPDEVSAHHILIHVASGDSAAQKAAAKAKAEAILAQLKAGANFEQLAKKDSDDPGTRDKGGDLGYFQRGQLVKPFEDAAFQMRPGEMTIVETQFGYHIIRVDDVKPAHIDTLEQARAQIVETLRHRAGADLARGAVDQDLSAVLGGESLKDVAAKRKLAMVETPPFAAGDSVAGLDDPQVVQDAFKLGPGETRVLNGRSASYLVKLVARTPSYIPALKDIQGKVVAALARQTAESLAQQQAESILKQIKSPGDFANVALANKLRVQSSGDFSRADNTVPGIGEMPEVTDAAALVPNFPAMLDHPFTREGNSYIFEVVSRRYPTDNEWQAGRAAFMSGFVQDRELDAWSGFVQALRSRARIEVHPDLIGGPAGA